MASHAIHEPEEAEESVDLGDQLGNFKCYQIKYFFVLFYIYGVVSLNSLSMNFLAPNEISFRCVPPLGICYHPSKDQCSFNSSCSTNNEPSSRPCEEWTYNSDFLEHTLTERFDIVCSRESYDSISESIFQCGDLLASLILGHLADRFGRKPVLCLAVIPGIIGSILAVLTTRIEVFFISKFLDGVSGVSLVSVGFVLLMEITGIEYRGMVGVAIELGWITFYIILPGLCLLLHDGYLIQYIIAITTIALLGLALVVDESPRWLLVHGKLDEAQEVMSKIMRTNGIAPSCDRALVIQLHETIKKSQNGSCSYNLCDLFQTPRLKKRTCFLYVYWFVCGFIYYGISLNPTIVYNNTFRSSMLLGAVEIPAYLICAWILKKHNRLWPISATMFLSGVFLCLITISRRYCDCTTTVTFLVLGKFFIASAFALVYPYTAEAVPTAVRSNALGSCTTFSRVAAVIAPFAKDVSKDRLEAVMLIFGVSGVLAATLVLFLEETRGLKLADTIGQGELMGYEQGNVTGVSFSNTLPLHYSPRTPRMGNR